MKKLKLDLDALAVESFDPSPQELDEGTILANQLAASVVNSCAGPCVSAVLQTCRSCVTCRQTCLTCLTFCNQTCVTCQPTCPATCHQTCPVTCQHTCRVTCWRTCGATCHITCAAETCITCPTGCGLSVCGYCETSPVALCP